MWKYYQPNPAGRNVDDCAVRAVSAALDMTWEEAYTELASAAYYMADLPSSNGVIAAVLRQHGFYRHNIPNTCPACYEIKDFAEDHPQGVFVVGTGSHVVAVIDGAILDSWDSSHEIPMYFWFKAKEDLIHDF